MDGINGGQRMKIKWRLAVVMAEREINSQRLHELTGLHRVNISRLKTNPPDRLSMSTLNKLCTALKCQPGDLLQQIED